eukprot:m.32712 g.32712  ORF g.32712 m.32712 type:complete len:316 (-) comp12175_c0_seq1:177-1124(-)
MVLVGLAVAVAASLFIGTAADSRFETPACSKSKLEPRLLIYTRLSKTGSTSLLKVLLSSKFNHRHQVSMQFDNRGAPTLERNCLEAAKIDKIFASLTSNSTQSIVASYDKHIYHVYFEACPESTFTTVKSPAFMTMLREPIARVASLYEYRRHDLSGYQSTVFLKMARDQRDWDFNECVRKKDICRVFQKYIQKQLDEMTRALCGMHPECAVINGTALQRAIHNLASYHFVGLTERHTDSLHLAQHLLPTHFSAVPTLLAQNRPIRANVNKLRSGKIQPDVRDYLMGMGHDHELYKVAVNLFEKQWSCLRQSQGL